MQQTSRSRVPWAYAVGVYRRRGGVRPYLRLHRASRHSPCSFVFVYLAGPRKIAPAWRGLYLILFKDNATRMGWLYPHEHERRRRETVKLLRTDNGTEVRERTLSEVLSKREKPTRAHRGRWAEAQQHIRFPSAPRLFPGKLPNLHRLWVQAAMYMNDPSTSIVWLREGLWSI